MNSIKNILWIVIALIVAIAIQFPMLYQGKYLFLLPNTLAIFLFIYYLRSIFEFNDIAYHKNKWIKYGFIVLNIFFFIYFIDQTEELLNYIDSMNLNNIIVGNLNFDDALNLYHYIKNEYLLSAIGAWVMIVVYNIYLIKSFWKRNTLKKEIKL